MSNFDLERSDYPFNTPLESGIRSLVLLNAMSPDACDIQRLMYYDYLMVHSEDVPDCSVAPSSLHPPTPYRSGEALVRRSLVDLGIRLMISKGLADIDFKPDGIKFRAVENTDAFLSYLASDYSRQISDRATWVVNYFRAYGDTDLQNFMIKNIGRWGAEFTNEAIFAEIIDL